MDLLPRVLWGGLVVSVLVNQSEDPSSRPAEVYSWFNSEWLSLVLAIDLLSSDLNFLFLTDRCGPFMRIETFANDILMLLPR